MITFSPEDLSFSVFYNAETIKIGCAYAKYKVQNQQRHVLKCLVNKWVRANLDDSYEGGDPCSACEDDNICDGFYGGLCTAELVGSPGPRGPPGPRGSPYVRKIKLPASRTTKIFNNTTIETTI